MRSVILGGMLFATTACAEEPHWNTSWDGTLYGYMNGTTLRADSVLNPANQIAGLAKLTDTGEVRMKMKV
jgi:hypothetical protein